MMRSEEEIARELRNANKLLLLYSSKPLEGSSVAFLSGAAMALRWALARQSETERPTEGF